jgi:hypothetical protein
MQVEHLMRPAKARARQFLTPGGVVQYQSRTRQATVSGHCRGRAATQFFGDMGRNHTPRRSDKMSVATEENQIDA